MALERPSIRPITVLLLLVLTVMVLLALDPTMVSLWDGRFRLLVVVAGAVAMGVGIWSAHRSRTRLARLAAVAEEISRGDYSARSGLSGTDSLASLSRSLDDMAERIQSNVQQIRASEQHSRKIAYYDSLTGLPNRRMFQELVVREVSHAKRSGTMLGVVILDLDHFKDVNDSLGHAYGDMLLQNVAKRLSTIVRKVDLVARLGGDEFAVLLTRAKRPEDLLLVIRRMLNACRQPFELDWREVLTSVSIGVSFFPQDGQSPEKLIRNADSALYQAKGQGRNNLQIFDSSMNLVVHDRLQLEQALRKAVKDDALALHYQPLVGLQDGEIVGFEALARWHHPERGWIEPETFISLAEQSGLMPTLGNKVLTLACQQLKSWTNRGLPAIPISVNVSVRQLQTGHFVSLLQRVLREQEIDPSLIQVEITESLAMETSTKILEYISAMNELGVRVAIDDFGTGYSSFSYLRQYDIDAIKIDRSFVAGIPHDEDDVAIVRAIISLGKNLGLRVVAEGIETQEQLTLLRDGGCDIGQGFLLGRPQPARDLHLALETRRISLSDRVPIG